MPIKFELNKNAKNGVKPVKIYTRDIDNTALTQLKNIAQLPFIHSHIAAMPDVHAGIGATVGSVIPTVNAIIPAAVGVDIGCGMMAVRTSMTASSEPPGRAGPAKRPGVDSQVSASWSTHSTGG